MPEQLHPEPFFALLCDYVMVLANGKHAAVGIFQTVQVEKFPGSIPVFYVLTGFSVDCLPGTAVEIIIANASGTWTHTAARAEFDQVGDGAEEDEPGALALLSIQVPNLVFRTKGAYEVRVVHEGHVIQRLPFGVKKK